MKSWRKQQWNHLFLKRFDLSSLLTIPTYKNLIVFFLVLRIFLESFWFCYFQIVWKGKGNVSREVATCWQWNKMTKKAEWMYVWSKRSFLLLLLVCFLEVCGETSSLCVYFSLTNERLTLHSLLWERRVWESRKAPKKNNGMCFALFLCGCHVCILVIEWVPVIYGLNNNNICCCFFLKFRQKENCWNFKYLDMIQSKFIPLLTLILS